MLAGEDAELVRTASAMTAGFAGGYGLRGMACGLLPGICAALALMMFRDANGHVRGVAETVYTELFRQERFYRIPMIFFQRFEDEVGARDCRDIAGRTFSGLDDYLDYMNDGGCRELIVKAVSLGREALDSPVEVKPPSG